jgi:protein TonB
MLISKFNLYRTEWLDLVFDDRNKEYGAYNLRQHYASNMVKAMGITFFSIAVLCAASIILNSAKPIIHRTPVDITPPVLPVQPPVKRVEPPKAPERLKPEVLKTVATIKDVPPVVVIDTKAEKPVKNDDLNGPVAIGQTTSKGEGGVNVDIPVDKPAGGGDGPAIDNTVHPDFGLDVMPEPVGGANAWSKFLNKNLRFPAGAQEDGISGKVLLSFIIEKDGHLSNITVDRPAGHGFDEEALRVLKLAKAWKPGMQNGQPVRVKYSIPINFQLANND